MIDLGTLGNSDRESTPIAINNRGQLIGESTRCYSGTHPCAAHAVLWTTRPR